MPVPPITKTFAYNKYYLYGSSDKKIEYEELKRYELEVVSVDELVSCVLHDIHDTYDKEKDSSKNGHVLRAVVVFVVNHNSLAESDRDEPRETASSQINCTKLVRRNPQSSILNALNLHVGRYTMTMKMTSSVLTRMMNMTSSVLMMRISYKRSK